MAGWKTGAVKVYLGMTGSGKTTLAQINRRQDADKNGFPCVTMDLEESLDWAHVPHAKDADEVLQKSLVERRTPRIWTPRDDRERAKFFMAAAHWGGICILIDGVPMIADSHYFEPEFRKALLRYRHGRLGPMYYYLTAQRASLMHRNVFTACQTVYIFRQAPGADADRVEHEFGIPPMKSTNLGRGENVPILLGFPEEGNATDGAATNPGEPPSKS
jgi:hypothetical protein